MSEDAWSQNKLACDRETRFNYQLMNGGPSTAFDFLIIFEKDTAMNISFPVLAATALCLVIVSPAHTQEKQATVTFESLTLETALELARAALEKCRSEGFQAAVSVVDRGGNLQVTLRDRFAGPHTPDTSTRKAWTAVSFRTDTRNLAKIAEKGEAWAIRLVKDALPLGGGVQIQKGDGTLVGAVGVSGAPGAGNDDKCARAGIAAIEDKIAF